MINFRNSAAVKIISWVLAAALLMSSFTEMALAAESGINEKVISEDEATEKDIVDKTESSTTYYLGNEKKMTVWHGKNVRFENDKGRFIDYDPSLVEIKKGEKTESGMSLEDYSYKNAEGDMSHFIPESLSENTPLLMEKEDYEIKMSLSDETVKMLGLSKAEVKTKEKKTETISGEEELVLDAVYEDEKARVTYTSETDSVKETIVLKEKPESSVFVYEINLKNMKARKNALTEGITYYDTEDGNITGSLDAAWMNDKTGENYSENIKYDLETINEKQGQYILKMTVDEEYLSSEDTVYPVTIDPTNTWKGDSELRDVYTISGSTYGSINFYDADTRKMPAGKNDAGTHRTFLKIYNLKAMTKGHSVESAKLTVYENGSGQAGQNIGIYRAGAYWDYDTITHNNRPDGIYLYDTVTTKGTAYTAQTFDVTTFVKNVARDSISNYGLVLYNKTENPGYACFYGSRTTVANYRPKLVVTYYSIPTTPTAASLKIKEGKDGSIWSKAVFVKDSQDASVHFSGITSDGLKRVEQRIRYWDEVNQEKGDIVLDYGEDAAVTNGGTMPALSEGCYVNFVRGVNKADGAGGYKTAGYLHVDSTSPVINLYSLSPVTSQESPAASKTPTVSWNVTDRHFKSVSIMVNGKVTKSGLTQKQGSHTFKSWNTVITKSGVYEIKIRAYDKAGNYKDSRTVSYYVDRDAPVITDFSVSEGMLASEPSKNANPVLSWSIEGSDANNIELYKGDEKIEDESITAQSESYTLKDGIITQSGQTVFTLKATDSLGNSSEKKVSYYADFDVPVIESISILPETSLLNPSGNSSPLVSWEISEGQSFKELLCSTDGENYFVLADMPLGSANLSSDIWVNGDGNYTLYFKAATGRKI